MFGLILISIALTISAHIPNFWFLIFIALIPFFYVLDSISLLRRGAFAFLWSFLFHLFVLNWISSVSISGLIALSAYNASYVFLFSLFWNRKHPVLMALIWVAFEWLKETIGPGSPFGSLAVVFTSVPEAMQLASLGGILLVSFWIIGVNAFLLMLIKERQLKTLGFFLPFLIIPFILGIVRLHGKETERYTCFKIGVLQPNLPPDLKWDPYREPEQMKVIEALTQEFKPGELDLLVFPETVFTSDFRGHFMRMNFLKRIMSQLRCHLLLGAPDDYSNAKKSFNSAFLIKNDFSFSSYNKVNLVPFGEYIPFEEFFPFVSHLTPIEQSFAFGTKLPFLNWKGIYLSPLICFEDTLSGFVRDVCNQKSDCLITLTNDGWFPSIWGPMLHERLSRYRAVENGISLIRCANTGVSSFVDIKGRLKNKIMDGNGESVNVRGTMKVLLFPERINTVFSKIGYSWIFAGIFIAGSLWVFRKHSCFLISF